MIKTLMQIIILFFLACLGFLVVMGICWVILATVNAIFGGPFYWPVPGLN